MNLASTSLILFLVLDPFGNMVMFHTLLERLPAERRRRVLLRELLIAFAILLVFLFAGSRILDVLGIRPATLSISGGILLFLIALGMVFPNKAMLMVSDTSEPFIVPLAVPMIAGPSAIALLLLIASKSPGHLASSALALSIAWAATALVLSVTPWFLRLLGSKGAEALERLMGLLLILIAVQMLIDGLAQCQIVRPRAMTAQRVTFEGRVQGVGFRYTVKDLARGFDVCGWVKNLPDGSVELQVMGEPAEVAAFIREIASESPVARNISRHYAETIPLLENCRGFRIAH